MCSVFQHLKKLEVWKQKLKIPWQIVCDISGTFQKYYFNISFLELSHILFQSFFGLQLRRMYCENMTQRQREETSF